VRRGLAALVALVALTGLTACGTAAPAPAPPPGPLRILLVNDDGWNAPGTVVLRDALRRAGHRVVEIAPVADRSSAGTATTTAGELVVRRPTRDPDVWTVSGTAADAVLVSRAIMYREPPDLVVTGVDSAPALGLDAVRSGSVGAAMTASGLGFPVVSVSTFVLNPAKARPDQFRRPADFTVRLVRTIQEQREPGLIGQRTILNVNYPAFQGPPRGVVAAPSSNTPTVAVSYRPGRAPDRFVASAVPDGTASVNGVNDDVNAFWRLSNVTLTDLSTDPDRAAPPSSRTAARLAPLMKP
jgi:5'-nucleotidase